MLLTLNEVKDHLRYELDDPSNDLILTGYILAAEQAIKKYVNRDVDINTKADIKIAAMLLVGFFDMYRNAEAPSNGSKMPYAVLYPLAPYRTPTIK